MGIFSLKKESRYLKEFDRSKEELDKRIDRFRLHHFDSVYLFKENWEKERTQADLEKERILFDRSLESLQDIKKQAEILLEEASKLMKFEHILTEKDKLEIRESIKF